MSFLRNLRKRVAMGPPAPPKPSPPKPSTPPPAESPMIVDVLEDLSEPRTDTSSSSSPRCLSPLFVIIQSDPESAWFDTSSSSVQSRSPTPLEGVNHISYSQCGSEPESGGSDEEETVAAMIPRSFRSMLETPEDESPIKLDEPAVSEGLAAASTLEAPEAATGPSENIDFFNFNWRPFPNPPIPPKLRRETFSNIKVGPTTPCADPYGTFIAIWDRQFMEHIASETNRYAQEVVNQQLTNHNLQPTSRIAEWRDTNPDELYTYFAIILAMGIVVKSRVTDYWSSATDIFYTPGFSAQMSLRRFQMLNKCLHFVNNEELPAVDLPTVHEAKLFKIRPVLSHLNSKFQSMYNLSQNIALDESLLQWKGWLDINQFIPNKAASVGIKTYELCESQTGYLWRFEVHAHSKSLIPTVKQNPLDAFTPKLVLRLTQGLENKGHTLWMDNFYNSPVLARKLKTLGFDCVGTLRTNRQFVPEALNTLTKANMRPGQITGFTSGDVDITVWRDQNRVATISTYHGNSIAHVNDYPKPTLILDYNIMMGGVDKKDQMLAMYPIERKRTRVWYKKFFRRLLNVSVLNAFILVKHSTSSPLTHRAFRCTLVKSLLLKHASSSVVTIPPFVKHKAFEAKNHHLAEYPFLPGNSCRQRRRCHVCKKRIHTYCVGCEKTLCLNPCFVSAHK